MSMKNRMVWCFNIALVELLLELFDVVPRGNFKWVLLATLVTTIIFTEIEFYLKRKRK